MGFSNKYTKDQVTIDTRFLFSHNSTWRLERYKVVGLEGTEVSGQRIDGNGAPIWSLDAVTFKLDDILRGFNNEGSFVLLS